MGQSLVLAGLDARSESWTRSGLPVLSRIPIIGALFGSTSDQKDDSRNLVLIVPTVLDAVTMTSRERIREALGAYEKFDGELDATLQMPKASDTVPRKEAK
jgi:type II secretory pathway component GspD/PulD (secretin)